MLISKTKIQKQHIIKMDGSSLLISDDFDFGSYAPSMAVNSRSGSMKYYSFYNFRKLARKTDQSPQPQDNKPKINDLD